MNRSNTVFQREDYNFARNVTNISPSNNHALRVSQNNSEWIKSLTDRFNVLGSLPFGWDGYLGQPVSFENATFAANLIEVLYIEGVSPPQLVPGSDGTLQFEWHVNQMDIEIDIIGDYNLIAYKYNHITEEEEELEIDTDFAVISQWLHELKNNNNELLAVSN